jgi:hypothetical protein
VGVQKVQEEKVKSSFEIRLFLALENKRFEMWKRKDRVAVMMMVVGILGNRVRTASFGHSYHISSLSLPKKF